MWLAQILQCLEQLTIQKNGMWFFVPIWHCSLSTSWANYGGVPVKAEYCHEVVSCVNALHITSSSWYWGNRLFDLYSIPSQHLRHVMEGTSNLFSRFPSISTSDSSYEYNRQPLKSRSYQGTYLPPLSPFFSWQHFAETMRTARHPRFTCVQVVSPSMSNQWAG